MCLQYSDALKRRVDFHLTEVYDLEAKLNVKVYVQYSTCSLIF
jgi:hypothetical protein